MSKLRILCLHDFTSNGQVHAHQVKSITSKLSKDFDFIFPDGPHEVDIQKSMGNSPITKAWSDYIAQNSNTSHRVWWFAKGRETLEKSLDHVRSIIKEIGPVHAIWAGIFFSGFRARFEEYDPVYEPGIQVPTLHILGDKDAIVGSRRSEGLIKVCRDPKILRHLGGHEIPDKEEDQQVIVDFLWKNVTLDLQATGPDPVTNVEDI